MGILRLLVFPKSHYNGMYHQNVNDFLIWYKIDLGFTVVIRRIGYLSNMKPSVE